MSLADQAIEDEFLDENLEKGYIVPSDSPYGFSTFMVPKKDSKEKRYIIDYRPLNAVTKKDITPLPNLAQCIEDLQGMELFSKFDIRWGYNNIRIHEGDEWKGTFKTHRGLYEPKVMFFGMSNSPLTFQRFVNHMLEPFYKKYRQRHLKNYMDDCHRLPPTYLIFSFFYFAPNSGPAPFCLPKLPMDYSCVFQRLPYDSIAFYSLLQLSIGFHYLLVVSVTFVYILSLVA